MDNIILIGMSGAGKSTLGVLLAKILNKNFLDSDLVIQQKYNKVLHKIINEEGLDRFKSYEEQILLDLNVKNTVIATGGSVIYSQLGMEYLRETGRVVYLHVPFGNIDKRLKDITTRGIVIEDGQTLKGLYDEREPLYRKYADITINIQGEGIEETLSNIIQQLK